MKLGLFIGYSGSHLDIPIRLIQRAEELGYDSVWTAEAYGSDALIPLAWIAAKTTRIRLAAGILQIAGRAPAMAAMQTQTLDALAGGGRVIAGLGVSGPQIVEGWYGQPWGRPYWRLRDYIEIMRKVNHREHPVTHEGREYTLPYDGADATGYGKALKSILHTNPALPIWLGAGSPSTVRLAAEKCDGWLPMDFVPGRMEYYREWIEEGFRRAGTGKSWADFEIQARAPVEITHDLTAVLNCHKQRIALYVGGMGLGEMNFHKDHMAARGYSDAAERVQELYLAGRRGEAAAAVPDEYVDEAGLFGSPERIARRWRAWEGSGITGLTVMTGQTEAIELMARLAGTEVQRNLGMDPRVTRAEGGRMM